MGPNAHQNERLVLIAVAVVLIGAAIPPYARLTARFTADGTELSRLGHAGVIALSLLIAIGFLLLLGLALGALAWFVDFVSRRAGRSA